MKYNYITYTTLVPTFDCYTSSLIGKFYIILN